MVRNQGRVTRFVVMAVLQAARAHALGLPRDSAFSWGLNRAIFYAAAKRGFRGSPPASGHPGEGTSEATPGAIYRLGDEEAFRDPKVEELVFVIGGKDQTAAEFEKAVTSRFGTKEHFRAAWEEALGIMAAADRTALSSRRRFYDEVYRPRRDALSDEWTRKYSPAPKPK